MQDEIIFEEQDGSTKYSIVKGIFYISDLQSKHLAYRVMKHVRYEKPIYEFVWDKVKAEIVLKELREATTDRMAKSLRIFKEATI